MKPVPAAARIALSLVLVLGAGIAVYLVRHHESQVYGDASVVLANCPQNETVNCEIVNTSAWSELFHVPIAAYAVPTYATLLVLVWAGTRRPAFLAYAFGIGLLTTLYSLFLLWVSASKIGFVCLWCMRLYGVNLSIPVLVGLAAWRSPSALLASALRDLRLRPVALRLAVGAFVAFLAVTIGAQQLYRAGLKRDAAAARERIEQEGGPLVPAVPESGKGDAKGEGSRAVMPGGAADRLALAVIFPVPLIVAAAPAAAPPAAPVAYAVPPGLRRVTAAKGEVKGAPFDLQARLGKGKPVGLIFWAPGYRTSERALVGLAKTLAKDAPQIELYAVAGRRDDERDEEIAEDFAMLDLPKDLPLLVDDKFVLSEALSATDVPNLALFSAKGALVVAKIKAMDQYLVGANGNVLASEVVHRVAAGEEVPQIKQMHPVYPSAELLGRSAPPFSLPKLGSSERYTFPGKPASGRPTLVMFWSATCKHCQVEVPQLVKWVAAHPGTVDIIGVSIMKHDKPGGPSHRAITQAYVKEQGIGWPIVEDLDGSVAELYENMSTPTTFFVAPSGKITGIWYYVHPDGLETPMNAELQKLRNASPETRSGDADLPVFSASLMGADGKRVELGTLLDKPAILHFWATWCKPCVEELPGLLAARADLEKQCGARLVLVSVEDEASGPRIVQFSKSIGATFASYRSPKGGLFDKIDPAYRVPRTYLLGTGGRVLASLSGSLNWADPDVRERVRAWITNSPPAGAP